MRLRLVFMAVASLLLAAAPAVRAVGVCALLTSSEVSEVLAQQVRPGTPTGPETDEDTGGKVSYCSYLSSHGGLVVTVEQFTSAEEARKQLTTAMLQSRLDGDGAKVVEEPGIGERSYWGASTEGAMVAFLSGSTVVQVGAGGFPDGKPATRKTVLRRLAAAIAARL